MTRSPCWALVRKFSESTRRFLLQGPQNYWKPNLSRLPFSIVLTLDTDAFIAAQTPRNYVLGNRRVNVLYAH